MNLYDLSAEYQKAFAAMQEAEFDDQTIQDTLEGFGLKEKLLNCAYYVQNAKAWAEAAKKEKDRIAAKEKALNAAIERVTKYMLHAMQETGVSVDDPVLPVKLVKCPPSLGEVDLEKIGDGFWKHQEPKLDRALLLKKAKESPIDGVTVITDKKRVKIG